VTDDSAYVKLLEYKNKEAMILASQATKKRVKNVKKLLKVGKQDFMLVINTDPEQGFIDLSKKQVKVLDVEQQKREFDKSKLVHLIMKLTAHDLKCPLIDLYEEFGWDLYDTFDHAYDAFKLSLTEPELVFSKIDITEEQKNTLLTNIHKKMAANPLKIRTRFNLQCYTYDGIDAIKEALIEAKKKVCDDQFQIAFQMIAPPQYKAEVITLDKVGGIKKLEKAAEYVQEEIVKRGGVFKLVAGPTKIGSKNDDLDNEDIVAQLAKNDEDDSSGSESNDSGMDVDLDEGIQDEDDGK